MTILIPLFGTFSKHGGDRVLSELANHWIKDGHKVFFLSHCASKDPYFPTVANVLYYNNKGQIVEKPQQIKKPNYLQMINVLRKAVNKVANVDVILANYCFTAYAVKFSSNKAQKFYYVQAYEPIFFGFGGIIASFNRFLAKQSYKLGLYVIVNSYMYKRFHEIISDDVVYPGLNFNIFNPQNRKEEDGEKFIIGTVGRTEKWKGTYDVIEAFRLLKNEDPEDRFELRIAFGKPEMLSKGITNIECHGDKNLADFYKNIDVYVCACTQDIHSVHYPVTESMSCKTLLITTGYTPHK